MYAASVCHEAMTFQRLCEQQELQTCNGRGISRCNQELDPVVLALGYCGSCDTFDDKFTHPTAGNRHDWFYYTSKKCAIPDDMQETQSMQTSRTGLMT